MMKHITSNINAPINVMVTKKNDFELTPELFLTRDFNMLSFEFDCAAMIVAFSIAFSIMLIVYVMYYTMTDCQTAKASYFHKQLALENKKMCYQLLSISHRMHLKICKQVFLYFSFLFYNSARQASRYRRVINAP